MDSSQQKAYEQAMDDIRTAKSLINAALSAIERAEQQAVTALAR